MSLMLLSVLLIFICAYFVPIVIKEGHVVSCGIVVIEILRGAGNRRDFYNLHDPLFHLPQVPIN